MPRAHHGCLRTARGVRVGSREKAASKALANDVINRLAPVLWCDAEDAGFTDGAQEDWPAKVGTAPSNGVGAEQPLYDHDGWSSDLGPAMVFDGVDDHLTDATFAEAADTPGNFGAAQDLSIGNRLGGGVP